MMTAWERTLDRFEDGLARVAIDLTVRGARRIPAFRERVFRRLSGSLRRSYVEWEKNADVLAMDLWLGRKLEPFMCRMLAERPRAAKRLVHLAYIWAQDVRRRSARAEKTGLVTPVTVVMEPTGRCNLHCPQCYADSSLQGAQLPYELWQQAIRESRDMGVTLITFTGGEPFFREAEDRLITRAAADFPDMGFLVYTNASLIDEAVAERLGEAGNVFPAISVEGYERQTDARRGKGYTTRATRVRSALARNEVMYGFSATVTSRNAELLSSDEFIERRIEEGDMFGWFFLLQPIGRSPDPSLLVTADQRARLREQVFKWRSQSKPIFLGDFWNDGCFVGGCIAGARYYFHIYANGDISPCVFAPIACGNIQDVFSGEGEYRSLADFANRHPFFAKFREKQKEIADPRAPCLLMDHPDMLREVCAQAPWYAANNMPKGYLDGDIARAMDACASGWHKALCGLDRVPECVRRDMDSDNRPRAIA